MNKIILITALLGLLLTGCLSTQLSEDIAHQKNTKVILDITNAEKIQLTYRFKDSLIADEKKAFYNYLGTDNASKELSPLLNRALGNTAALAKSSFLYSTEWENALLTGNVNQLIGTTLLAGVAIAAITPSKERHKHQFKYYQQAPDDIELPELMKISREDTINSIYSFADIYGYEVKCDFGCIENKSDNSGDNSFILSLKENTSVTSSFHKPNFLYVTLDLKELKKSDNIDSPLLGSNYNYQSSGEYDWRVSIVTPHNNREPTFINRPGGRRTITSGTFAGSKLHRKFYEHLTKEIQGLSYFTNGFHTHLAFYNGKTYQLYEKLTNNSIVKGILK
jgi:hypothetical protein